MNCESVKSGGDERRRLLREFFLNACLMAMAKRAGEEAVALEELEAAHTEAGSEAGFGLAEIVPCA